MDLHTRFRELADGSDGMSWEIAIISRIDRSPLVRLTVRGSRGVNVTIADPTAEEIGNHLQALAQLAGAKGVAMGSVDLKDVTLEDIVEAKREALVELDEEARDLDEKRAKLRKEIKGLERIAARPAKKQGGGRQSREEAEEPLICPLEVMKTAPKRDWTPAELVERTGRSPAAVSSRLNLLRHQGLVTNSGRGKWRVAA